MRAKGAGEGGKCWVRVGDTWCSEGAGRVAGRWPGKVGNQGVIHSPTNSKGPTLQACHQK